MFNEKNVTSMVLEELQHHSFTEFENIWNTLMIFKGKETQHYISDPKKALKKINEFDDTDASQLHVVDFIKKAYLVNVNLSMEIISTGKIPTETVLRSITFAQVNFDKPVEVYERLTEIMCLLQYNYILHKAGINIEDMHDHMDQKMYVKIVSLVRDALKNADENKIIDSSSISSMKIKFQ